MREILNHPYKILKVIASRNLMGCLTFSLPNDESAGWQLYVDGDRLCYATAKTGQKERLNYLWQQMQIERAMPELLPNRSEYESLTNWQHSNSVSPAQFKRIILDMSREALIHALSYNQVSAKFDVNSHLDSPAIEPTIEDAIGADLAQVRGWKKLHAIVPSPFSRPYLDKNNIDKFQAFWNKESESLAAVSLLRTHNRSTWIELLGQKLSFYEIATAIAIDVKSLATVLQPLAVMEAIAILPFQPQTATDQSSPTGPLIACIDDSHTVQRQVKGILEIANYRVLSITDPASSLTTLARNKPSLILMDISMPEIDGYELCRMLHQSRQLKDIPIVMFTGRDGLVDRVRAQLVGAADYITKNVEADLLVAKVRKLTQPEVEMQTANHR